MVLLNISPLPLCFLIRSFSFFASVIDSRYFLHISAPVSPLYFPPLDPKFEWKSVRTQQNSLKHFMSKMERQWAQMNLQHIYSIQPCLKRIILRNSIHGGMGWWYKRPNFFQLFNLFYHQEHFAGSTICDENYDNWQNLSSTVEGEGVTMPRRQFFMHIYQKIPQKSVNNKAILSNTITKQSLRKIRMHF